MKWSGGPVTGATWFWLVVVVVLCLFGEPLVEWLCR